MRLDICKMSKYTRTQQVLIQDQMFTSPSPRSVDAPRVDPEETQWLFQTVRRSARKMDMVSSGKARSNCVFVILICYRNILKLQYI